MNFKRAAASAAALALIMQIAAPITSAQMRDPRGVEGTDRVTVPGFCERVSAYASQLERRLADRRAALDERRGERGANLAERREERDERREAGRARWDGRRDAVLARLEARASSDAQKAAIVKFRTDMERAAAARREAAEAAKARFHSDLDALIVERRIAIDALAAAFREAVDVAFDEAKDDCESGTADETARVALRDALEAAQRTFQEGRQAISARAEAAQERAALYRASLTEALDAFKAAAETARAELKATFADETGA